MRFVAVAFTGVAVVLAGVWATAAETKRAVTETKIAAKSTASSETRPADEKEIRQVVDMFVKSYNNHGAQAIAGLFAAEGTLTDEDGNISKGRKAIEDVFAGIFKAHPTTKIENTIESIRFVGPNEAIETGVTTVTHDKDTPAEESRYQVVHVKEDGKWQMAAATDLPEEDQWSGEEELNKLESLIGQWVDENPDALVLTSYEWTDNHRFILGQFAVQVAGKPAMTGTHRIGWDPLKKTIHSWVFDSEGSFAEGVWTHDGEKWEVKMTGTTRGGKPASATQIITPVNKNRMTFQTVDRMVGDKKLPDSEQYVIVRRPPTPKSSAANSSEHKAEEK